MSLLNAAVFSRLLIKGIAFAFNECIIAFFFKPMGALVSSPKALGSSVGWATLTMAAGMPKMMRLSMHAW